MRDGESLCNVSLNLAIILSWRSIGFVIVMLRTKVNMAAAVYHSTGEGNYFLWPPVVAVYGRLTVL